MSDVEFTIEKSVPRRKAFGARLKPENKAIIEVLETMEINDSFLIPGATSNYSTFLTNWGKTLNRRFSLSKTEEGIRVWRVPLKEPKKEAKVSDSKDSEVPF